jgi:hypothetical protein
VAKIAVVVRIALYGWAAIELGLIFACVDSIAGQGVNVWFGTPEIVTSIAMVALVGFAVTGLIFLVWVYQAMSIAHRLASDLTITPGWAVGWFFVPVASLWKPHVVITELVNGSGDRATPYEKSGRRLVDLWWAAWIARLISNSVISFAIHGGATIGRAITTWWLIAISAVFGIAAALLLEAIVHRVSLLQRRSAVHVGVFD